MQIQRFPSWPGRWVDMFRVAQWKPKSWSGWWVGRGSCKDDSSAKGGLAKGVASLVLVCFFFCTGWYTWVCNSKMYKWRYSQLTLNSFSKYDNRNSTLPISPLPQLDQRFQGSNQIKSIHFFCSDLYFEFWLIFQAGVESWKQIRRPLLLTVIPASIALVIHLVDFFYQAR